MKRLELNTGLSYSIRGFSCVKGKPFEVGDVLAEQLIKTGRFTELPDEVTLPTVNIEEPGEIFMKVEFPEEEKKQDEDLTAAKVAKMKNDELIALAASKGISLDGCKKHDEYVERINGALGLVDFSELNWD